MNDKNVALLPSLFCLYFYSFASLKFIAYFFFLCNRNTLSVPSTQLFTSCWEEASLNTDFRERFSTESNDQTTPVNNEQASSVDGHSWSSLHLILSYFSLLNVEFQILSCVKKLQKSCQSNKIAFGLCAKKEVIKECLCIQCTCIMLCRI